jgi:hypothetical protein
MPDSSPQCPSCAFDIPAQFYIRNELRVEPECDKRVVDYPNATHCPYYQREPGSD